MRFEPYNHKMGCVAVQQEGRWWVAHPNGDAEPAKSIDDARAKALFNNTAGDTHVGFISSGRDWQRQPSL